MKYFLILSAILLGGILQGLPVPDIHSVPFAEWRKLADQADKAQEGKTDPPVFSGSPASLRFADGEPYQGHIALGDVATEMRVNWAAKGKELVPYVQWGKEAGKLTFEVRGTADTYTSQDMCGAQDDLDGFVYSALIQNLTFNTRYYYRFGFKSNSEWSKEYSFVTPPAQGSFEAKSIRFIAYGDMGYFDSGKRVAELIEEDELDKAAFIMHVGDLSYADGEDKYWDDFMDQIEPLATKVPYFVNIGNHEVDDGECAVPYNKRFTMPTNGLPSASETRNLYYSFNWGPVHLVQMSTEHDFTIGSEQWNFLVSDLKNVNRTETPWLIFTGHRMMYSNNAGDFGESMREELEDILMEYKVDLAWWGHAHQYERTCAVYREKCVKEFNGDDEITNPGAPVHIVMGMAGRNYQYAAKTVAEWEDVYEEQLGYTRITADHNEFQLKFIREKDGDVVDNFKIFKS